MLEYFDEAIVYPRDCWSWFIIIIILYKLGLFIEFINSIIEIYDFYDRRLVDGVFPQ